MDAMPFGRFKGEPLGQVPDGYLQWLAKNVKLREPLLSAVGREFKERGLDLGHQPAPVGGVDLGKVQRIYRDLAARYHPDKIGGSGDVMRGINIFMDRLKEAGA
jgi:uncharacterized protein (DUF3820 family)